MSLTNSRLRDWRLCHKHQIKPCPQIHCVVIPEKGKFIVAMLHRCDLPDAKCLNTSSGFQWDVKLQDLLKKLNRFKQIKQLVDLIEPPQQHSTAKSGSLHVICTCIWIMLLCECFSLGHSLQNFKIYLRQKTCIKLPGHSAAPLAGSPMSSKVRVNSLYQWAEPQKAMEK